ncbi:Ig-like domain-containing protein [Clostridium akagii]|uniref:Ig-like domain-containing protein n=1 Tax=Clostridium akagii TaxID=91623 RepID=UPI000690A380|nr:Ig domain-containing protein [Clostridium akagii]
MKKHFKLIGVFLCALLIGTSFIFSKSSNNKVYADDNSEVGTANLNNTADNSAKVGDQLVHPEKGWKRYDDSNSMIQYIGNDWVYDNIHASVSNYCYNKGSHISGDHYGVADNCDGDEQIKFKFTGSKIRIIAIDTTDNQWATNIEIKIDGNSYTYSNKIKSSGWQSVVFEKTDLENNIHNVIITNKTTTQMNFDAVDIDDTGSLDDSSTVMSTGISLDKTSLDMKTGDTSNLTAIVAPDNSTNKIVKWTSSDPSIATVDANGKITAVKEGSATITASTQDGSNKTATCTVNVKNPADGNGLLTVTMTDGQQRTYDIKMSQINDFITWYNNRANGQGNFTYSFNKTPSSAAYTKRTEYLVYDKISNYDVDEYKAQN